ncbi:MAG: hypothetical protein K2I32_02195, partial [Alistipes sp.]|nr:hypothetical protein [Alistipes sp.]
LHVPASGFRERLTGALSNVGAGGWAWSASPYAAGNENASGFRLQSGNIDPMNNFERSYGFTVRCVQHLRAVFIVSLHNSHKQQ